MAKINNLQSDISKINIEINDINGKIIEQNTLVQSLQKELNVLRKSPRDTKVQETSINNKLASAQNVLNALTIQLDKSNKRLRDYLDKQLFELFKNPQQQVAQLNDEFPILMFPVRLETRFKNTAGKPQLWVRVYPDDCNVVKREIILSQQEYENTKAFWIEMLKANGKEELQRGAWTVLVNNHGDNRAEWLIKNYKPLEDLQSTTTNADNYLIIVNEDGTLKSLDKNTERYWKKYIEAGNQPDVLAKILLEAAQEAGVSTDVMQQRLSASKPYNIDELVDSKSLANSLEIKILNLPDKNKLLLSEQSWNSPPEAVFLPDKFVAITYQGNTSRTHVFPKSVSKTLHTGIDPSQLQAISKNDELDISLNPQLAWMTDFEKAVDAGMGIKIDLQGTESQTGFDKLLVLGVRISSNNVTSQQELETLIKTHHLSDEGFAFLKQGTPTNNTEEENSGYSTLEKPDESFDRIFKGKSNFILQNDSTKKSDGQRFANLLGLNPIEIQGLENANLTDASEAAMMNQALFPATLGYFMDEMLDTIFTDSDITQTKSFFTKYVSGRGPIPAFRIGKQPYSILPTTAYSKLKFSDSSIHLDKLKSAKFFADIQNVLNRLDNIWKSQISKVAYIGKAGNDQQNLLDVLGLHPNSVEFRQRFADGVNSTYNTLAMQAMNAHVPNTFLTYYLQESAALMKQIGISNSAQTASLFLKYFKPQSNLLNGPLVDDVPLSEIAPIRAYSADNKNYISWLINSAPETIRKHSFGAGKVRPKAMLYILLHHAMTLAQAVSSRQFLIANKVLKDKKQVLDQDFIHVDTKETQQLTKYQVMFNTYTDIANLKGSSVVDYLYKKEVFQVLPEIKELRETIDALKTLENLPTARLERLLVEHLDCCNYRLDAWKIGLVNAKLEQQIRSKNANGLYLGAYGVLLNLKPKAKALKTYNIQRPAYRADKLVSATYQEDPSNLGYIHAPSMDQAVTAAVLRNAYDAFPDKTKPNPYAVNLNSERVRLASSVLDGLRNGQPLSALLGYQFERGLHDLYETSNIEADKFIYPLRLIFPLVNNKLPDTKQKNDEISDIIDSGKSMESVHAQNVIDGLQFINHYQKATNKNYPFGLDSFKVPSATVSEAQAIKKEVERIIDIYDAISDMVVAESMYQVVKGNYDRAAAITNAFSKGTFPPEIEFIKTPRSGVTMTHKLAVHFDDSASNTTSPNSVSHMSPRARTEAGANAWLSNLLPDPKNVVCLVKYKNSTQEVEEEILVSQYDLNLQSIDVLYSANLDMEQSMTELDDRIVEFVSYQSPSTSSKIGPFTHIEIVYDVPSTKKIASQVSFFELSSLIKSLRTIVLGEKSIKPEDLQLSTESSNMLASYDTKELKNKITGIYQELQKQHLNLESLNQRINSIEKLSNKFVISLSSFSIPNATLNDLVILFEEELKVTFSKNHSLSELQEGFRDFLTLHISDIHIVNSINSFIAQAKIEYLASLDSLDTLIKDCIFNFNACAFLDNTNTGSGFIYSLTSHLKEQFTTDLQNFLKRWQEKIDRYATLLGSLDSIIDDERKALALQELEGLVTASVTLPIPTDLNIYKQDIQIKAQAFHQKYADLNALLVRHFDSVNQFVVTAEQELDSLYNYELRSFDSESDTNIPVQLKKNYLQLHEELANAVLILKQYIADKLSRYHEEFSIIDQLIVNKEINEKGIALAKKLTTDETIILPTLILHKDLEEDFNHAYLEKDHILEFAKKNNNSVFPVEEWFSGIARVRKNVWHMENIMSLSYGFNSSNLVEFTPLQFPAKIENRWLALQYVKSKTDSNYNADEERAYEELREDSLLYTVYLSKPISNQTKISGFLIDSWTESVPLKEETTGVAFHYDQPNSEPPHTMLLMVTPEIKGSWDWNNIVSGINETLDLAKMRAVEPSMLATTSYAQLLPTTMFAVTSNGLTATANLAANISDIISNK